MNLRFADHPSFHRAALGMVGGSALVGLALHPATSRAPLVAGILGIAIGATLGYGKPAWRAVTALAAAALLVALAPSWPALAVVAALVSFGIAAGGPRGLRGLFGVLAGATIALIAMWTALRIGHAQRTVTWPAWASDLASATAMGLVGVLALLPRHVRIALDPVAAMRRGLPRELDGEVRELCDRSVAIWHGAQDQLAEDDPGRGLVRDGVLKALDVAARSAALREPGTTADALARRMQELDERIAAATDAETRAQYQEARAALGDQQRYRDQIRASRERLVARLHNHVAALEKFQLAAGGLRAARAASAGAPALRELDELSHEVAASGEALAELELAAAS